MTKNNLQFLQHTIKIRALHNKQTHSLHRCKWTPLSLGLDFSKLQDGRTQEQKRNGVFIVP